MRLQCEKACACVTFLENLKMNFTHLVKCNWSDRTRCWVCCLFYYVISLDFKVEIKMVSKHVSQIESDALRPTGICFQIQLRLKVRKWLITQLGKIYETWTQRGFKHSEDYLRYLLYLRIIWAYLGIIWWWFTTTRCLNARKIQNSWFGNAHRS